MMIFFLNEPIFRQGSQWVFMKLPKEIQNALFLFIKGLIRDRENKKSEEEE